MEITKEQFDEAYNKHLPKRWIRFAYKYFSKETEKRDLAPSTTIVVALGLCFLTGMLGTIMNWPRAVIAAVTYIYMGLLTLLVGFLFAAVQTNNRRLKKVMKILGVSKQDYNLLADKYYQ